ncbi:MAG: H-type lectin domain-containing protein [Pseudomonadota bacterium]
MAVLTTGAVGVETGTAMLFDHIESDGKMWAATGDRVLVRTIKLHEPFSAPPVVHVAQNIIDAASETNLRMMLTVEAVTEQSFDVQVATWADTRIGRLGISWLAIGPVRDPEEYWDV